MTIALCPVLAVPADLADLRALHLANWRLDYAGVLPADALAAPAEAYMDEKWSAIGAGGMEVFVQRDGAGLLGFASIYDHGPQGVFLDNLHVAKSARGRGLGRLLLQAVAARAGARSVALEVLDGNAKARAFYRALGGTESPPHTVFFLGTDVVERRVTWPSGDVLDAAVSAGMPG